jgi:hypothetical protein
MKTRSEDIDTYYEVIVFHVRVQRRQIVELWEVGCHYREGLGTKKLEKERRKGKDLGDLC